METLLENLIAEPAPEATGLEIHRSRRLRGALSFPGDAHMSMMAVGLAALGRTATRFENLPEDPWFQEFKVALQAWGVAFESVPDEGHWLVGGGALHPATESVAVRHEIAALILSGIDAGAKLETDFHFDLTRIPSGVLTLLEKIQKKAFAVYKPFEQGLDDGAAKIFLLFRSLASGQSLEMHLRRPGSDLLENLLRHFEIDLKVERDDAKDADELTRRIARQLRAAGKEIPVTRLRLPAAASVAGGTFLALPGDVGEASVAALSAILIKGSDVLLENVLLNSGRGGLFSALRRMGADIEVVQRREKHGETVGSLRVRSSELFGKRFDAETLAELRDEVFLLLLAAAFAEGESVFRDLEYLRSGPVDLLKEFINTLKRIGIEIGEFEDGLVIRGRAEVDGGAFNALGHPGLAAAFAVLGLKAHGSSRLTGSEVLDQRFPGLLARLGALTAPEKDKSA